MKIRNKKPFIFIAVLSAILLISAFILWVIGLGVLPSQSYAKSQFYDLYHSDDIDTIFVGPSFMYRSINPEIIDEYCGTHSFNLGTSAQKPIDSYFVIKEAIRVQPVKCVVLDVTQGFYCESAYTAQNESTYIVYDRMKNSEVKTEYFHDAFGIDEWVFGMFKACHYDFPSFGAFTANVKSAFENEKEPAPIKYDNEWYAGKGFVYSNQVYDEITDVHSSEATVSDAAVDRLKEIVQLCKDNSIRLIAVASPKTNENISETSNYNDIYLYLKQVLADYGIEYYDYSVMDEHKLFTNDCFVDAAHLNGKGAEIYSNLIAKLIME